MNTITANNLSLPVVVAPMFLVSGTDLVLAACRAGLIGSFPFPNARTLADLDEWLTLIKSTLQKENIETPWAVNLTTHSSYDRLADEVELIKQHQPPIVITALGGPKPVLETVHAYGGKVIADVNSVAFARKAVAAGVDGLALISCGAGGHTGHMVGPAFVTEVRKFFDGTIILAGGIGSGSAIRAAQIAGADLCYMGTRFIATAESIATDEYKAMVVKAQFEDLVLSDRLTGAKAWYLRQSLEKMGLDPNNLGAGSGMNLQDSQNQIKAWKDIWSAGHGVGSVTRIAPLVEIADQLKQEYQLACQQFPTVGVTQNVA